MPPQYVKAYVKRNKNDAADAEAICEAVKRPSMRFVPVKTAEQQSALLMHRGRELLVRQRTMLANTLRGHLAEFGGIAAQGLHKVPGLIAIIRDDQDGRVPDMAPRRVCGDAVLLRSKAGRADPWLASLRTRKHRLVVAVALANKTARIAWAIMSRGDTYRRAAAAA